MVKDLKYFTPLIEDIRVGYECEWLLAEGLEHVWQARKADWMLIQKAQEFGTQFFRVPYLTKEQIEAEEWKEDTHLGVKCYSKGIHKLFWFEESIISIDGLGTQLYRGECKDINTFRYICKLLKTN